MISKQSQYLFVNFKKNNFKIPFHKREFNHIFLISVDLPALKYGEMLEKIFAFQNTSQRPLQILLVFFTGYPPPLRDQTPLQALWNYFLSKPGSDSINFSLLEIGGENSPVKFSDRMHLVFQFLKPMHFENALFYTASDPELFPAHKIGLFLESSHTNRADLNFAAYTLPFYKGAMINFWMMPLSALFGRKIRNVAVQDFIFSKHCLQFWMKQKWPDCEYRNNLIFFLTLSAFTSGLKINEFFLGEKKQRFELPPQESVELIHTGLGLIERYKTFIKHCLMLLPCHTKGSSPISFSLYDCGDLPDLVNTYEQSRSPFGKKFFSLAKKNLPQKLYQNLFAYFHTTLTCENVFQPDDSWNVLLLSLIDLYLHNKSSAQKARLFEIIFHLFGFKIRHWASEIKMQIQATKEKAHADELRGCPWTNGEKGQFWHIHDNYEKKLNDSVCRLHSMKADFF